MMKSLIVRNHTADEAALKIEVRSTASREEVLKTLDAARDELSDSWEPRDLEEPAAGVQPSRLY